MIIHECDEKTAIPFERKNIRSCKVMVSYILHSSDGSVCKYNDYKTTISETSSVQSKLT